MYIYVVHVFTDILWQSASITVRIDTLRVDLWPSNEKINLIGVRGMLQRTVVVKYTPPNSRCVYRRPLTSRISGGLRIIILWPENEIS